MGSLITGLLMMSGGLYLLWNSWKDIHFRGTEAGRLTTVVISQDDDPIQFWTQIIVRSILALFMIAGGIVLIILHPSMSSLFVAGYR